MSQAQKKKYKKLESNLAHRKKKRKKKCLSHGKAKKKKISARQKKGILDHYHQACLIIVAK